MKRLKRPSAGSPRKVEKVQAGKGQVALLELVHDPQGLQVVLEATPGPHAGVQRILAGVTKGCVPEVVGQRDRLDQLAVQVEAPGHRPADLGDLQRVREARPEEVALVIDEDLRLVDQPPKAARVHDAVPVALVLTAVGVGRLRVTPAPAPTFVGSPRCQFHRTNCSRR